MLEGLKLCPCCGRSVNIVEARSIFDFSIKICKRCALNEKVNPKFNWIEEVGINKFPESEDHAQ